MADNANNTPPPAAAAPADTGEKKKSGGCHGCCRRKHRKFGFFYHNNDDVRTFVPKCGKRYFPWGARVNTATTEGKVYMAAVGVLATWTIAGMIRDSGRS